MPQRNRVENLTLRPRSEETQRLQPAAAHVPDLHLPRSCERPDFQFQELLHAVPGPGTLLAATAPGQSLLLSADHHNGGLRTSKAVTCWASQQHEGKAGWGESGFPGGRS